MSPSRFSVPGPVRGTVLVVLAFLAYIPALRAGFIWDDVQLYIVENPLVQRPGGLAEIWTTRQTADFYPLTYTMWWLEWRLWGAHPAGYHLVNVLLHAASGLLLWRLLVRLRLAGAWVAALLWVLHPVNVESVAWISERKNTLAAVFFFAALLAWLLAEDAGSRGRKRDYALALASFLLALLAKSSVVPLPLVLLLLCFFRRGTITRRDVGRVLPFALLALGLGLVTASFQARFLLGGPVPPREAGVLQRFLDAGWAIWFYLWKALVPHALSTVYAETRAPSALAGAVGLLAAVAVTGGLWTLRARWGRAGLLAWGYFVAMLLPVLGFVTIGFMQYALVADRWQYLALVAPVALAVGIVASGLDRRGAGAAGALALALVATLAFCLLTFRQARIYTNEGTLWTDTLRKNPHAWVAYSNLGEWYLKRTEYERAEPLLRHAMQINPHDYVSPVDLAAARVREGRLVEAAALLDSALRIEPDYALAHSTYGALLLQQGRPADALPHYDTAVRANPSLAVAHLGRGNTLVRLGRRSEAAGEFRAYTSLLPASPNGYFNLALVQLELGDANGAARSFEAAARRGDLEAQRRLSAMRAGTGRR